MSKSKSKLRLKSLTEKPQKKWPNSLQLAQREISGSSSRVKILIEARVLQSLRI